MIVDKVPWTLWLVLAVLLIVLSIISRPNKPVDILPKARAVDEPLALDSRLPYVGHMYNYVTQGPAYLVQLW